MDNADVKQTQLTKELEKFGIPILSLESIKLAPEDIKSDHPVFLLLDPKDIGININKFLKSVKEENGEALFIILTGKKTADKFTEVINIISKEDLGFDEFLEARLKNYITELCKLGQGNLYSLVIKAVEKPLIQMLLRETRGNQLRTAKILGVNRNTLRKKVKDLDITI